MKKLLLKIIILSNAFFITHYSFSQAPEIDWEKNYGGDNDDYAHAVIESHDGGFMVLGSTESYDGDVTGLHGFNEDFWLTKLYDNGDLQWQKCYGGTERDYGYDIVATIDGGYIMTGITSSFDGDVIGYHGGDTYLIPYDFWIVKITSEGDIEWQKTMGGTNQDYAYSIIQTTEGDFVISGYTFSTDGDISYNHGGKDYWVIKLDNEGHLIWEKTYGGSGWDIAYSLVQTTDLGFIICGSSSSEDMDVDFNHGMDDNWVIKLNPDGEIEWQKSLGGTFSDVGNSIIQTFDGGYITAGYTRSHNGNSKGNNGLNDFFVVKLNSSGMVEWDSCYGGSDEDYGKDIIQTIDGGYIVAGRSYSDDGQVDSNLGYDDAWAIKISIDGELMWTVYEGSSHPESFKSIIQTDDLGYLFVGNEREGATYYQNFMIRKLHAQCTDLSEICNSLDDNCNGLIDDDVIETISIAAAGPTTFCQGGSVILNATTSGPNYQWKKNGVNIPGAILSSYTVSTKGTYTCETSSACDTELSTGIFVNVQKNPPASITAGGATTFCAGGSVILTANTGGGLSYKWYKDAVLIPGATSINYTATTAGFYKCNVIKTASGCNKNSNGIMVTVPCKEGEELSSNSNFTIFPNPNNGTFNLVCNSPLGALSPLEGGPRGVMTIIEIFNSLGQQLHSQQINSTDGNINETISIYNLSSGIYFIRMWANDIHYEKKLIIE